MLGSSFLFAKTLILTFSPRLNYDKYETQIQKKLTQLRDGLKTLEEQLAAEEEAGVA